MDKMKWIKQSWNSGDLINYNMNLLKKERGQRLLPLLSIAAF